MRIGFLFNHFFAHQVAHAAPYAFELSRRYADFEILIACSSREEMDWVQQIGLLYSNHRCRIKRIRPPLYYRALDYFISPWKFKRKKMVLMNNLDFFRSLDALVSPERHCMMLRQTFDLRNLRLIHARHGAGDRRGGFDDRSGAFDLTLLPGQKYVDRLKELDCLPGSFAVIGWPKFEVVYGLNPGRRRFFENDNPVVVYNPHFDQSVASWELMGLRVLEFFASNPDFNLIFAPHVVLFKRYKRHKAFLPRKYRRLPNILIDTGSRASADMTYMLNSDIYLGDVSSQVYEFLHEPRPCIHLNAHHVDWKDDPYYFHFNFGEVVDDVEMELRPALTHAKSFHDRYIDVQRRAFEYTFNVQADSTAAQRGADAIAQFLAKPAKSSTSPE